MKATASIVGVAALFASADSSAQARTVLAHHVVLEGVLGNEEQARERLLLWHRACLAARHPERAAAREGDVLGLPSQMTSTREHLYFASDRIVEDQVVRTFRVDELCRVEPVERRQKSIHSTRGVCTIDFRLNEARGPCRDGDRPARPSGQLARAPSLDARRLAAGDWHVIAGLRCQMYRTEPSVSISVCVARPESRFPLGSSSLNQGMPGLPLSHETSTGLVLRATAVSLHEDVPAEVFQVPAGVRFLWINP